MENLNNDLAGKEASKALMETLSKLLGVSKHAKFIRLEFGPDIRPVLECQYWKVLKTKEGKPSTELVTEKFNVTKKSGSFRLNLWAVSPSSTTEGNSKPDAWGDTSWTKELEIEKPNKEVEENPTKAALQELSAMCTQLKHVLHTYIHTYSCQPAPKGLLADEGNLTVLLSRIEAIEQATLELDGKFMSLRQHVSDTKLQTMFKDEKHIENKIGKLEHADKLKGQCFEQLLKRVTTLEKSVEEVKQNKELREVLLDSVNSVEKAALEREAAKTKELKTLIDVKMEELLSAIVAPAHSTPVAPSWQKAPTGN